MRSEAIAQGDLNLERLPKATPFRVGKRDWCAAFEVGEIYESIRGNGHLSRSFYRTEGPNSALRQSHTAQTPAKEAAEKVEISYQVNGQSTEESNLTGESKSVEESQKVKSEEPPVPLITVFVKEFDAAQQCLVERGAYQANSATNVTAFLRDQLKIDEDEIWSFYHEHTIHIKSKHLIKRSSLFFDLAYGDEAWDGILIVAQRQPTAAEYVESRLFFPVFCLSFGLMPVSELKTSKLPANVSIPSTTPLTSLETTIQSTTEPISRAPISPTPIFPFHYHTAAHTDRARTSVYPAPSIRAPIAAAANPAPTAPCTTHTETPTPATGITTSPTAREPWSMPRRATSSPAAGRNGSDTARES